MSFSSSASVPDRFVRPFHQEFGEIVHLRDRYALRDALAHDAALAQRDGIGEELHAAPVGLVDESGSGPVGPPGCENSVLQQIDGHVVLGFAELSPKIESVVTPIGGSPPFLSTQMMPDVA